MDRIKITLVKIGHIERFVDFDKLKNIQSKVFEIIAIASVAHMPPSDIDDSCLDQKYTNEGLQKIIECPINTDIAIAIMPYRFVDNFYIHRIGNGRVVISIHSIPEILNIDNISMENFIIKQIYEICAIKYLVSDFESNEEIYNLVHRDTRGCLFDMNGYKMDILFNTEKPIVCDSCKDKFRRKQMEEDVILVFEKELKKIKKPLILRIEKYIKRYPLASVLITGLLAIFLNIFSNFIYDQVKSWLNKSEIFNL